MSDIVGESKAGESDVDDTCAVVIDELGCHFTWPELQGKDTKTLERTKSALASIVSQIEECDFATLPSRSASLVNLQGFIAYSLKDDDTAIEKFEQVLQHDPQNHNALASLAYIYEKLGHLRQLGTYLSGLKHIHSKILTEKRNTIRSRSLVDRGHAVRFFEQDSRQFSYMSYFREAAEYGQRSDCTTPERAEWIFDYALALYRRDNHFIFADASLMILNRSFREAAEHFYGVTTINAPSVRNRALSWVFLGVLLNNVKGRYLSDVLPNVPDVLTLTAEKCLRRGLQLSQGPYVTRRVAAEFLRMGHYDLAMKYFDMSLKSLKSWFAYRHKGRLLLAMYEDDKYNYPADKKELLFKAKENLNMALEMKEVHADYSDLGYVYFLLGEYRKAARNFKDAVLSKENDYFNPADTYHRWSRCLEAMGEIDGAQAISKKGETVAKKIKELTMAAGDGDYHGDSCQGDCNKISTKDMPGYINLVKEYRIHLRTARRKTRQLSCRDMYLSTQLYNREDGKTSKSLPFDFLLSFDVKDEEWALALLTRLEKDQKLRGIIHFRDFIPGEAIVDNIVHFIEKSYKTIVILTPNFIASKWCRYELKQAHCVAMESDRNTIVPILLQTCEVPKEIRDLTYFRCQHGQLSALDFDKLTQLLTQSN